MATPVRAKPVESRNATAQPASAAETRKVLDASPGFAKLRDADAGKALVSLFGAGQRFGAQLPGTTARDRLQFVLGYTESDNKLFQFRVDFSDKGFRPDMRDSPLYDTGRSNQVGHFLTAVKLGFRSNGVTKYLAESAAVGHELTGDSNEASKFGRTLGLLGHTGAQIAQGLTHPGRVALFGQAVTRARSGDRAGATRLVEQILPDIPWSHAPWSSTGESHWTDDAGAARVGRRGNSRQDMLLTAYGVALGSMVRDGELETPGDVSSWLRQNVTGT